LAVVDQGMNAASGSADLCATFGVSFAIRH
jgi:hypothetical protein